METYCKPVSDLLCMHDLILIHCECQIIFKSFVIINVNCPHKMYYAVLCSLPINYLNPQIIFYRRERYSWTALNERITS